MINTINRSYKLRPAGANCSNAEAIVGGHEDIAEAKMMIIAECGFNAVHSPVKSKH